MEKDVVEELLKKYCISEKLIKLLFKICENNIEIVTHFLDTLK